MIFTSRSISVLTANLCLLVVVSGSVVLKKECKTEQCVREAKSIRDKIDFSVHPCDDMYSFSCGSWIGNVTIPPGEEEISPSNYIAAFDVTKMLRSKEFTDNDNPIWPQIKTFYDSCMDLKTRNALGAKPLKPYLAQLLKYIPKKLEEPNSLTDALIYTKSYWARNMINYQAVKNGIVFGKFWPMIYYYGLTPAQIAKRQQTLTKRISNLLKSVLGDRDMGWESNVDFDAIAGQIVELDRQLNLVTRGTPGGVYKSVDIADLGGGLVDMKKYLQSMGIKNIGQIEVTVPYKAYFADLWVLLQKQPINVVKYFFIYMYVQDAAAALGEKQLAAVNDLNRYFGKYVGTSSKNCAETIRYTYDLAYRRSFNRYLGLVSADFDRAREIFKNVKKEFVNSLNRDTIFGAALTKELQEYIESFTASIGVPDILMDNTFLTSYYSTMKASAGGGAYLENYLSSTRFLQTVLTNDAKHSKIEYMIAPYTGYDMVFETVMNVQDAILQYVKFSNKDLPAVQYATLGDHLAFFAAYKVYFAVTYATLNDKDLKSFNQAKKCFEKQYSNFKIPGVSDHVDGEAVVAVAFTTTSALQLAWNAWETESAGRGSVSLPGLSEYSEEQLFFIRQAQKRCRTGTAEWSESMVGTDRMPPNAATNGPVMNFDKFSEAFKCKPKQAMNPANRCQVF